MFNKIVSTDNDTATLMLRAILGSVLFTHGAQKLLGWFGGYGFSGTMAFFTGQMGIPWVLAFMVIIIESFGALAIMAGFLTRVTAFGVTCIMVVAVLMLHARHGFFMNWFGNQKGEGFEYHILAAAIAVALMIKGGGRWSVDGLIARRV